MILEGLIAQPTACRIGWTLVHFVWQGAAVAAVAAVILRALRNSCANARYAVACAALAVMAAMPGGTFVLLEGSSSESSRETAAVVTPDGTARHEWDKAETVDASPVAAAVAAATTENSATAVAAAARRLRDALEPYMPWVAAAWASGVVLLSARFSAGWVRVRRTAARAMAVAAGPLMERFETMARRLGVSRPVRLLESALVRAPLMTGWLKPVILFPAGMATGLPIGQLEAIIAHELAHVRRHDYLVNLVQSAVETFLFYHPCVWWLSRRIRIEREHCADDMAVGACGDRLLYARTLADLAQARTGKLAVAAGGGELFGRIRRLVASQEHSGGAPNALIGAAIAVAALALLLGSMLPAAVGQRAPQDAVKAAAAGTQPAQAVPGAATVPQSQAVGHRLTVRVLTKPGGAAAAGVTVRLWPTSARQTTDAGGKAVFEGAQAVEGGYRLVIENRPPGELTEWTAVEVKDGDVECEAYLEMPQGVSGTVRDADAGTPVAGAEILVSTPDRNKNALRTDAQGNYIVYTTPRAVTLECKGTGERYCSAEEPRTLSVAAGRIAASVDFEITSAPEFRGNVSFPDGKPAAGAKVQAYVNWWIVAKGNMESESGGFGRILMLDVDENGEFVGYFRRPDGGEWPADFEQEVVSLRVVAWLPDRSMGAVMETMRTADLSLINAPELVLEQTGSVTFQAMDAQRRPVENAKITAWDTQAPAGDYYEGKVEYLGSGRYRMGQIIPGLTMRLVVEKRGYSQVSLGAREFCLTSGGQDLDLGEISLDPIETKAAPEGAGATGVTGVVVDEAGTPVEGAEVTVLSSKLAGPSILTDEKGRFRLDVDRPSFRYATVLAVADEGLRQGIYESNASVEAVGVKPLRITLKPSGGVRVKVTDAEDKPVEGALAQVYARYAPLPAVKTDSSGTAIIRFPAEAVVWWITALKPGAGFDYYENYTSAPPGWSDKCALPGTVKLVLDGAQTVKVMAVDTSGKPVSGVPFVPGNIMKGGKLWEVNLAGATRGVRSALVPTDDSGVAVFDWLPAELAENTTFLVRDEAFHCPDPPQVKVADKGAQVVARLLRTTRISGKVFLPDGHPAAGIVVQAEGRGKTNHYCRQLAESGDDGSYSINAYPDQSYIVAVTDKDWAAANCTGLVVREGTPVEGLDFHLDRGTLVHGKLTMESDGAPVAAETVTLVYKGRPLPDEIKKESGDEESLVRWATTDKEGQYAFRVGKGNYKLWASDYPKRVELAVGDETEIVKDFGVQSEAMPMAVLTGTVVEPDAGNRAVAGAIVKGGHLSFNAIADRNGRFKVVRAPAEMGVYARNSEGTLAGIRLVSAGDTDVTIFAEKAASVSGRVVDGEGKPLANRRIVCQMNAMGAQMAVFLFDTLSDSEGRYTIDGLVPELDCFVHYVGDPEGAETEVQLPEFRAAVGTSTLDDLVVNTPAP